MVETHVDNMQNTELMDILPRAPVCVICWHGTKPPTTDQPLTTDRKPPTVSHRLRPYRVTQKMYLCLMKRKIETRYPIFLKNFPTLILHLYLLILTLIKMQFVF